MQTKLTYEQFLETKRRSVIASGFECNATWPHLYPFQEYCVKKALLNGKYALFEDCGLGKTRQQLTWADEVSKYTVSDVLILAPLAVVQQTIYEAQKIGIPISEIPESETRKWFYDALPTIYITNYEQLDNIADLIPNFAGVVLDESSILKNYSGETKQKIITYFANTKYKLACTATPSPNDELEMGNHAEFLNVMSSQDMRAMFFTTDKEIIKGNKYRLKKHAIKAYYRWVSSWAIMISKPSDIGFSDEGYNLPLLQYIERAIVIERRENGALFNSVSVSATSFNGELRLTKLGRIEEAAAIANASTEQFIIWIKHNEEGAMLRELIPGSVEVSGSNTNEVKKKNLIGFANNAFRVLITKSKIASFGMNYQNCHNQIHASLDFSFEALYQSIRRSYRFGQKHSVNIYIITTDTMQNVIDSIREKEDKFILMQNEMREAILAANSENGLKAYERKTYKNDNFEVVYGDCVPETAALPDNSIPYCFFSPPFGAMYVFSNDERDMSNVTNNAQFLQHFTYLVEQLYKKMMPGRLVTIHMMQSTTLLGRDGYYSIVDFRGDLIRLFQSFGFYFHEEHMIRKDPKTAAIRTKNRQLMHGTTKKDSTIVRPGLADYVLSFRKPGENPAPVLNDLPFDLWCRMAEPCWVDIEESDTLKYMSAKDEKDERHITPTQLTPIKWSMLMYSNKGEEVYSPYSGIASEGVVAMSIDRKYKGVELKESYWSNSIDNLKNALEIKKQPELFAL